MTAPTDLQASPAPETAGPTRPPLWQRAYRRLRDDRVTGWLASLLITLLAFALRIYHLGTPHEFEFDETYYAKDAWSLLHFGYARNYASTANDQILAGHTTNQWESSPEMIVHPEVGKWLIAIGEKLWGMDPFGWRIASCVVGSLMILLMIRFVRRVTGSMLLGCVGGLLLCFDGLQFVLSRLGLLDIFLAFFVLLAVHCMVADRDHYRRRLARRVPTPLTRRRAWGPVWSVLFRPWLLAAGVAWGLAVGTKWEGAYPLAGFGILYVAWCAGARRGIGVRLSWVKALAADGVPAFLHLVLVAVIVYTATWTGWLMHAGQYETSLSSTQYTHFTGTGHCEGQNYVEDNPNDQAHWPTVDQPEKHGVAGVLQNLESLWYYHRDVYTFHTHFLNCATHSYASKPSGWLLLNRPVSVAAENGIKPGQEGCDAPQGDTCLRQVVLLGTPVLWWGGCLAAIAALFFWIGARDWRFGVAIVGIATSWLTWLPYATRPIFSYYAIVTLPFLVLAVTLCIGKLLSRKDPGQRTLGVIISGAFFVLVLCNFAWFWPVYTNDLLTRSEWLDRIWFKRWI